MKIALYRKYRPKRFADVIGQDAVVAALKNQVKTGRIGHSYIFTGIRGTGKTSFAKILAKAVNCPDSRDGEPCGVCDICTGIDNGSMLDVTEIDAASNSGVDNVRALREETAYYPAVCKMRVYIIDEVHMLTREAFNALLKIMEEPPAHVLFILATTEVHKVPATILSRCQRYDLRRIQNEDIVRHLQDIAKREDIDLTDSGAALVGRLADGAMRDALSLLDTASSLGGTVDQEVVAQLAGVADKSYLFELVTDISAGDMQSLFARLAALYAGSLDPTRLCLELVRHYRNLLMVKVSGPDMLADCSAEEIAQYQKQAKTLEGRDILQALDRLGDTADKMAVAPDRMLALELCFIQLCSGKTSLPAAADDVPWDAPKKPAAKAKPASGKKDTKKAKEPAPESEQPKEEIPEKNQPEADLPVPQQNAAAPAARTAPDGTLFERWGEVVEALLPVNGMLYGFLKNSRAFVTDTHVLIDADDIFLRHMRENSGAKDIIKETIFKTTGVALPIGPYTSDDRKVAPQETPDQTMEDFLARAAESGVEIEIL